jgi:hypothetical protein
MLLVLAICRALAAADEACQAQPHDTAFVEWLGARGANFSAVEVFTASDAEGGRRGVRARRALRQGELAAFVPHGLLLDAAAARASSPFGARFLLPALARLPPAVSAALSDCDVLALFHAFERGANRVRSPWRPYLDALPTDFGHLPGNWAARGGGAADDDDDDDARRRLHALLQTVPSAWTQFSRSQAAEQQRRRGALDAAAAAVFGAVVAAGDWPGVTEPQLQQQLRWALDLMRSRTWGDMWKDPRTRIPGSCFMLPGIDLINHAAAAPGLLSVVVDVGDGDDERARARAQPRAAGWGIVAHKDLAVGEEVFYSYSSSSAAAGMPGKRRCHHTELFAYGFLDTSSPSGGLDCYSLGLSVELPPEPAAAAQAAADTQERPLLRAKRAMLALAGAGAFTLTFGGTGAGGDNGALADWGTPQALAAFELPAGLLAILRAHVLQEAEAAPVLAAAAVLLRHRKENATAIATAADWARAVLPLENERRALRALRGVLANQRALFATSIEEDAAAVARGVARGEPIVGELAVRRMRIGEQVVIALAQKKVMQLWAMELLQE